MCLKDCCIKVKNIAFNCHSAMQNVLHLYRLVTFTLTHLCRVESSTSSFWTGLFPIYGVSGWFLLLTSFAEISIFKENIVDPDQAPRSGSTLFLNVPFTERQA